MQIKIRPSALTELWCHAVGYVLYDMCLSSSLSSTIAWEQHSESYKHKVLGQARPGGGGMATVALQIAGPKG